MSCREREVGNARFKTDDLPGALACYSRAINIDPGFPFGLQQPWPGLLEARQCLRGLLRLFSGEQQHMTPDDGPNPS